MLLISNRWFLLSLVAIGVALIGSIFISGFFIGLCWWFR